MQRSKSGNGDAAASPYLPRRSSDDDAAPTSCSASAERARLRRPRRRRCRRPRCHPGGHRRGERPSLRRWSSLLPDHSYRVSKPLVIATGEGVVRGGLSLVGGGGSARHPERPRFAYPPQTVIFTDALTGPALQVGNLSVGSGINDVDLFIRDMSFVGVETAWPSWARQAFVCRTSRPPVGTMPEEQTMRARSSPTPISFRATNVRSRPWLRPMPSAATFQAASSRRCATGLSRRSSSG